MKVNILILISFLFAFTGCDEDHCPKEEEGPVTNGKFVGTFEREGVTSNVTLTLVDGKFEGTTGTEKFPALCNGTYVMAGDKITFTNNCAWTADFDWSLILNGEWNYTFSGETFTFNHTNGDRYRITKQ